MDRLITQVGMSIYEWMLSKPGQNAMVGLAKLTAATLGTSTICNGLAATPTSPASLQIQIGAGEIYQLANLENTLCGTLPQDTAHQIVKQGIQLGTYTTAVGALAAPGTSGQSINYLIEAQYADSDVSIDPTTGNTPVVLQFYDSTNPTSPYSGPNGGGQTSNTFRNGIVSLQVKAGTAATTGSQVTPSPDSGWVGLWVVTVANGQSTITAGNITQYSGAPFLNGSLLSQIQAIALGQCYFQYTSATQCTLIPKGGNAVTVNGVPLILPAAGITVSNAGLVANTLYYAYLGGTTAAPTLTFSTAGHSTASNGVETQTGNTALTLVGMVYTTSSSQFAGGAGSNSQSVLSWFNRKNLLASYFNAGNSPTFTNTSFAIVWSASSISYCTWGDDVPDLLIGAGGQLTASGASMSAYLAVDNIQSSAVSAWNASVVNGLGTLSANGPKAPLSEGFHISALYANVSSGTGGLSGINHQAYVRG